MTIHAFGCSPLYDQTANVFDKIIIIISNYSISHNHEVAKFNFELSAEYERTVTEISISRMDV